MRTPDARFDPLAGEWYQPVSMPLPRSRVIRNRYRHTCPDGTRVRVSAQLVPATGATLYRWTVGGKSAGSTAVAGLAGEPDWTAIDTLHPLFDTTYSLAARDAAEHPAETEIEMEPDCYVCQDAGCVYCGQRADEDVVEPEFPDDPVMDVPGAGVPVVTVARGGLPW